MKRIFKKFFCNLFLLVHLSMFFGCATLGEFNPATGRKEFIFIPTGTEVSMGANIHEQIKNEFSLSSKTSYNAHVQSIGQRLARVSDRQDYEYKFYVIDKDEINAFTTPGGNIYFFSGLLKKLRTDDQIAAVLAHEIGHCAARHTIKKYQAGLGFNLIGSLIFSQVQLSEEAQKTVSLAANVGMNLAMTAYSRKDEYEADRLGIKYMLLADYNPNGMIETLKVLEQESHGTKPPIFLSTHPYVEDRIKAAEEELKAALKTYGVAQDNP